MCRQDWETTAISSGRGVFVVTHWSWTHVCARTHAVAGGNRDNGGTAQGCARRRSNAPLAAFDSCGLSAACRIWNSKLASEDAKIYILELRATERDCFLPVLSLLTSCILAMTRRRRSARSLATIDASCISLPDSGLMKR